MENPKITLFFDLDGTVLDISERHYRIYSRITDRFNGAPISKQEYWQLKQQKLPWPDMLEKSGVDVHVLDDFMELFIQEIEKPEELAQDKPIDGAPQTLALLKKRGYPMYLVSLRRGHERFLQQLQALGLAQYFVETLSGHTDASTDDLKAGLIANKLGDNSKALLVGDTEADVLAGKQLGITTVAVRSGIRSGDFLAALKPDYIIDDITALPTIVEELAQD